MPVIVIGADTPMGNAVVPALRPRSGEVRVFGTDPDAGERLRGMAKVAVGDLSDGSHVGGAAIGAFCAVVIAAAAHDGRERYFAATPQAVFARWADGLSDAGISRIVAVGCPDEVPEPDPLIGAAPEYVFVDTTGKSRETIAAEVAGLEAATSLDP